MGILRICGDNAYPPFEYCDENGEKKGFNIELMEAISDKTSLFQNGFEIELLPWGEVADALFQGKKDAIQGMSITEERRKKFDFSDSYFELAHNIYVLNSNKNIYSYNDLEGANISVQTNDPICGINVGETAIRDTFFNMVFVEDLEEGFVKLIDKSTDAVISTQATARFLMKKLGCTSEIRAIGQPLYYTKYAFGVRKGNIRLIQDFNSALEKLMGDGTFKKLNDKWFGANTAQIENQIVQSFDSGVVVLNALGMVVLMNDFAKQMLMVKEYDVRMHYRDIKGFEFLDDNSFQQILSGKKIENKKEFTIEDDINHRVCSSEIFPIYSEKDEIGAAVVILKDITKEKNLYQQLVTQDKMMSLGLFMAKLAHEIRNPLTSIKAFSELLPKNHSNPEFLEEFNKHVPSEIHRLERLVTEVLDYSGTKKINKERVYLQELCNEVINFVKIDSRGKRQFEINIPPKLWIFVDRDSLRQILLNAIINSIEATSENGKIEIRAFYRSEEIIIQIEDNGCGIKEENLSRLYDPFFTTKKSGSGLGLTIIYSAVNDNGGKIFFHNNRKVGACAEITFYQGGIK